MGTPLRQLPPASAWNEAMRRAMVISLGGFFVPNLLASFGAIPQVHEGFRFIPGVCGAVGVFFASMGLFLGYLHRKWIQGITAAISGLVLPYGATWFWFRSTHPSFSVGLLQLCGPTLLTAAITYFAFMMWHARLSSVTFDALSEQMAADDYGKPQSMWGRIIYRVSMVIGAAALIFLLLAAIGEQ